MLRRVEEITDKLLREAFPDAYVPAPKKKRVSNTTDDRWLHMCIYDVGGEILGGREISEQTTTCTPA